MKTACYTNAMQEIMDKRINKYADMSGHTVKKAIKKTNSDGGIWLIIIFDDGYWVMFEPVRYEDNDVTFHIIDDDHWSHYHMYLMKEVGICSKEVYDAENEIEMAHYHACQEDIQRRNIMLWVKNFPDLIEKIKNDDYD